MLDMRSETNSGALTAKVFAKGTEKSSCNGTTLHDLFSVQLRVRGVLVVKIHRSR